MVVPVMFTVMLTCGFATLTAYWAKGIERREDTVEHLTKRPGYGSSTFSLGIKFPNCTIPHGTSQHLNAKMK